MLAAQNSEAKVKGTNKGVWYFARFLMLDGTYRYIYPTAYEIDEPVSLAAGKLVLIEGADPGKIFCREAFGSYQIVTGIFPDSRQVPIIHHGLFFSYDAKFVGAGKGTPVGSGRCAFRFDIVVKASGFSRVDWGDGFDPACIGGVKGAWAKLKKLRCSSPEAPKPLVVKTDEDPMALALAVRAEPVSRFVKKKYGSKEAFVGKLSSEPATTLISIGRAVVGKGTKKLKDALYREWLPVVRGLARRTLDSVRSAPLLFVERFKDEGQGIGPSSLRSRYGHRVRALYTDLVQEGFLCLFELAAGYGSEVDDLRKRFDKKAYVHIRWRLHKYALTALGQEDLMSDAPSDDGDMTPNVLGWSRDMSIEDQVDYHTVCASGAAVLAHLVERDVKPDKMRDAISVPHPSGGLKDLCWAATGVDDRPLTSDGELMRRYLELEATLSSGYRRLTAVPRYSVEVA